MTNQRSLSQPMRLGMMVVYAVWLGVVSKLAFGQWFPPLGYDNKGFWFYAALLSLLLGRSLVTPFYTSPANAFSFAIPALAALFIVNNWGGWSFDERLVFAIAAGICGFVAVVASFSILLKDSASARSQRLSNCLRIVSDVLGNPKVIFSFVILFALYAFHRDSPNEMWWIGVAWATTVALDPLEAGWQSYHKMKAIWAPIISSKVIGEIAAYQAPDIVLIRQQGQKRVSLGTPLVIKDPHAPSRLGMALDYTGRDEGMLLRAIEVDSSEANAEVQGLDSAIPIGMVASITDRLNNPILDRAKELVGIVAPETSIERLYFEVVQDTNLEEGRLVEVFIDGKPVLYQIVNGLTKEDVIHQKNTYGYARAQAQKVGRWDEENRKFKPAKWLPKPNAPVFLKSQEKFFPDADAIGHFPNSNYTVSINNIHDLVTHNTAILGILGVGKSMLAIELVERMIAAGIKVICLDLTGEYEKKLAPFYDKGIEQTFHERLQTIGSEGKSNVSRNVEEGGSWKAFADAVEERVNDFLKIDTPQKLLIFNPAGYEVWRQDSKPFKNEASMATLTPTEIARIISEAALKSVQQIGISESKKARICLVYEEAHSLVPEWSSVATEGDKAATNGTARAILQGRKYGMGCLLITQRTANVTKTILNQCNTIFAMRTFDDTGKGFLSNYIGEDYTGALSSLPAKHAIFFGKASSCENPVLIRLNDRDKFLKVFRENHPVLELTKVEAAEVEETGSKEDSDDDIPF